MFKAFGIVNSSERNIHVEGLQDYRAIGAFSFLGRYRVIDFPISNMTNSGIEYIQVYVKNKPRSLVEHLGTGRHYNINSKSGNLQLLFSEHSGVNDISSQSTIMTMISITPISTTTTPIWSASKQFIIRMLLSLRIT